MDIGPHWFEKTMFVVFESKNTHVFLDQVLISLLSPFTDILMSPLSSRLLAFILIIFFIMISFLYSLHQNDCVFCILPFIVN